MALTFLVEDLTFEPVTEGGSISKKRYIDDGIFADILTLYPNASLDRSELYVSYQLSGGDATSADFRSTGFSTFNLSGSAPASFIAITRDDVTPEGVESFTLSGRFEGLSVRDANGDSIKEYDDLAALQQDFDVSFSLGTISGLIVDNDPPANRAPAANQDTLSALQNTDLQSVTVDGQTLTLAQFLLRNDSDPDGNSLSITGISDVSGGIAVSFNNGNVIVSPMEDFVGTASFNYTISDGKGGSASASASVTVNAVPGITRTGTTGDDKIFGTIGKDTLNGGNGNDIINGGRGADSINGGNGIDTLIGGRGNDTVTGGNGADVFVLAAGEGSDTFTDFKRGTDVIGLSGGLTFNQLAFNGNTIKYGDEVLAILSGVNTTTLSASNFVSY